MISFESLTGRPGRLQSKTSELNLPPATTGLIEDTTKEKIELVKASATKTLRLRAGTVTYDLLSVGGGQKLSKLTDLSSAPSGQPIAEVESIMMYNAVLKVMKDYGLREDIHVPDPDNPTRNFGDGTTKESLIFSSSISGIVFRQTRIFNSETGDNMNVAWSVCTLAPRFKVGSIEIYESGVREALKEIAALKGRQ